jgi:hypothetical protein
VVAGSLSLIYTLPTRNDWLRPLSLEAFSGTGAVWNPALPFIPGGYEEGDFLIDAGFGLAYDVAQVRALRRWTGQSDVLSNMKLVASHNRSG